MYIYVDINITVLYTHKSSIERRDNLGGDMEGAKGREVQARVMKMQCLCINLLNKIKISNTNIDIKH